MLALKVIFTLLGAGRVGEVQLPLFLQHARRHRGVNEGLVEEQLLHRQGLPSVQAAHHYATPAVVLVLVPHVHQDAAVAQLHRLGRGGGGRGGGRNDEKVVKELARTGDGH